MQLIPYTTFQAGQLLKKYNFDVTLEVATKIGEIIISNGYEKVENKIKAKRAAIKAKNLIK